MKKPRRLGKAAISRMQQRSSSSYQTARDFRQYLIRNPDDGNATSWVHTWTMIAADESARARATLFAFLDAGSKPVYFADAMEAARQ